MKEIEYVFQRLRKKRIRGNPLIHRLAMAEILLPGRRTKLDDSYLRFYRTFRNVREMISYGVTPTLHPLPILLALSAQRRP